MPVRSRWGSADETRRQLKILQFVVPLYGIYRLVSRDYAVYALYGSEGAIWPRPVTHNYPTIIIEILNGQVLFKNFYWPNPVQIQIASFIAILCLIFLILGIYPRTMALMAAAVINVLHGFMQITNAEVDGGTLTVATLFWFSLMPSGVLNTRFVTTLNSNVQDTHRKRQSCLFGYQLLVASFYFGSGLMKLIDVGPHWIFTLHLDRLAQQRIYEITFVNSRFGVPWILDWFTWYPLSVVGAIAVLLGELGLLACLIMAPKFLPIPIVILILMHTLIFLTSGINFLGNSILLILMLPMKRRDKSFLEKPN